jgi:hypothetical protein
VRKPIRAEKRIINKVEKFHADYMKLKKNSVRRNALQISKENFFVGGSG